MKIRWILFSLISILVMQCAKQTAPTGGPKDETPPKLKESYPKHEQTNFKGDRIELFFDEAIQLDNPREQIIITPTVGKKFEVTANKSRVTINLNARLQENTTYNINFREAIKDLTEKNPANIKLAFSTGDYIDSLNINGKVFDALTEKIQSNYMVALAEASDTLNIFKQPATWLTLTNKKGFFSLENLKPGKYFIYAFDDRSKNLIVDSKSEAYGFVGQYIDLQKNLDSLKINTFKLDVSQLKLLSARTTFAYFNIRFSKSLINYTVTSTDSTQKVYSSLDSDLTTLKLYNTIPDRDSLQIKVHAKDSLGTTIDTLLYMKFPKKEATRDKLTVTLDKATVTESNSIFSSQIIFSKPIVVFTPDSLRIEIDSLTQLAFSETEYTWNENRTQLNLLKKIDLAVVFPVDTTAKEQAKTKSSPSTQRKKAELILRPGAFISVERDTTKLQAVPLTQVKLESTGIIEASVKTSESFIVQLINRSGKIVGERLNEKDPVFENLPPDVYRIRVIIDHNKNGKWDPGNFSTKTAPEPIVYYQNMKGVKDLSLKANWTLDKLLITY